MTRNIDSKLAFIVGHYKSGSTWLTHLLSLYPGIRGVKETHVFNCVKKYDSFESVNQELFTKSAWGSGGLKKFPRFWLGNVTRGIRSNIGLAKGAATLPSTEVPASMLDLGIWNQYFFRVRLRQSSNADEYCKHFFSHLLNSLKPEKYLVEKTPTNIFHVEDINRIFPDSKIISIHRDGRDVVVSDKHHVKREYNRSESFAERVGKCKKAMDTELEKAKQYEIHLLSYEDLHSKPEPTVTALLDFLELDYDAVLLDRMISGSSFEALSGGRSAGTEDTQKFFRKGIVGDWRNNFTEDEIQLFSDIAGELLVTLGYESSPNWKEWAL